MAAVSVRYIVDDVEAAIGFYTEHLGFSVVAHPAPQFAILSKGKLKASVERPNGTKRRGPTDA